MVEPPPDPDEASHPEVISAGAAEAPSGSAPNSADVEHARAQDLRRAQQLAASLRATSAAIQDPDERHDLADRLCSAAVGEIGARGVTLCVVFVPGMSVPVGVSDPGAARAEELQFSAGEGPCWQACTSGQVVVADLADAATSHRRWPAYAPVVWRELGYGPVVAIPVQLASSVVVVFTLYGPFSASERWWSAWPVVAKALRVVLDEASPPTDRGGPVWLDSSTTLRRGAVWVAETVLVDHAPSMEAPQALEAMRTYGAVEGLTVDAVAAALVQGHLSAPQILG